MQIKSNTTPYSTRAMKTIAAYVHRKLSKDLAPKQLVRIDWKNLKLHFMLSRQSTNINGCAGLKLSTTCTEFEFAHCFCALLKWRAGLKGIWKTDDYTKPFNSDTPLPRKAKPKLRPKKETLAVEKLRREYQRTEKAIERIDDRIAVCKKEKRKIEQKIKRAIEASWKANKAHKKAYAAYMKASEQTTELDNTNFATRMRAKRNAKEDNSSPVR